MREQDRLVVGEHPTTGEVIAFVVRPVEIPAASFPVVERLYLSAEQQAQLLLDDQVGIS